MHPAPLGASGASGTGCKTRLESRIKKRNPVTFMVDVSGIDKKTVTVSETFDFAGETMKIEKQVAA